MPESYAQRVYEIPGVDSSPVPDQVAVDDSPAVQVLAATEEGARRGGAILLNGEAGDDTVYIGAENTVTSSTGFPLIGGASMPWPSQSAAWGICGSGDSTIVSSIDFPA